MPAATSRLALPYPIPDDSVDVPRDVQALAVKLDGLPGISRPPVVPTLPASPVDGQEIYLQLSVSPWQMWHLRYSATWQQFDKWDFLGGTRLYAEVPTVTSTINNAAFQDLGGPEIIVPYLGSYMIEFGAYSTVSSTGGTAITSPRIATNALDADAALLVAQSAGASSSVARMLNRSISRSDVRLMYRSANNANWNYRWLALTPIRVG